MLSQSVEYIDSFEALAAWCTQLTHAREVAIDTEGDSFFRYREKTCLIQMTALGQDVIIDPFAVADLSPLAAVLADASCTKILHDAGYDLICLKRDYNFDVVNIFDTMLASRLLGARHFGLAALLQEHFGFSADKRYQRSDWSRRPLTEGQLNYARYDTHYLPQLRAILAAALEEGGRSQWAREEFVRLPANAERAIRTASQSVGFWRITGAKTLSPEARGRLRQLFLARERIAQRLDRPTFKVLSDDVLLALAVAPPAPGEAISPRPGLRDNAVRRFGAELTRTLHLATPIDEEPPKTGGRRRRGGRMLEPVARERYEWLREARRVAAEAVGLDPEVTLGNAALEEMAKTPPVSCDALAAREDLVGWRADILLAPLWQALGQTPSAPNDDPPRPRGRSKASKTVAVA